jgi:hypothetical protein
MQKMTVNDLLHDGWRRLKIVGDAAVDATPYLRLVPSVAQEHAVMNEGHDDLLDLFWLEILYPVYGAYEVMVQSARKFRRLMFVHHVYGRRVSECIELARVEFFAGTRFAPVYAFVQKLPRGAEDGMDVRGCILLAAEWMPANCVATGGCDV